MIGHIDGWYVAAQIRLLRQRHKGTILLVEGETDARVFEKFIDSAACDIEIGFGKKNALEALDLLEEEGFPGVTAIVDADFDRILGKKYELDNLCLTDMHDLDLTIFASKALERYVGEHGDKDLIGRNFGNDYTTIRERILAASLPLAYCRYASEWKELNIYFKDLRHDEYIACDDLSIELDSLIGFLISRSKTRCAEGELKELVKKAAACGFDAYQLVNGHDVAAVLGIALRQILGSRRDVHTWASEIESGLRLAFDWEAMESTNLYRRLKEWENRNRPYVVLRGIRH
jgi:hypothetical protein